MRAPCVLERETHGQRRRRYRPIQSASCFPFPSFPLLSLRGSHKPPTECVVPQPRRFSRPLQLPPLQPHPCFPPPLLPCSTPLLLLQRSTKRGSLRDEKWPPDSGGMCARARDGTPVRDQSIRPLFVGDNDH